jgi:hypothetical protein
MICHADSGNLRDRLSRPHKWLHDLLGSDGEVDELFFHQPKLGLRRLAEARMSESGPPLPTCAVHQSRQLSGGTTDMPVEQRHSRF